MVVAGSRYIDWLIPGLLGMNIMSTGMWGIGFSIVQARLRKLLKRLAASPMRRSDYLLAQMLARLAFPRARRLPCRWDSARWCWACRFAARWSPLPPSVCSAAFTFTGIGLLAASRPKTIEAISGVLNMTMLPMWVLCGVFFSSSNFPARCPAVHPGAATDGPQRRACARSSSRARRCRKWASELAILGGWAVTTFCARAQTVQVAITVALCLQPAMTDMLGVHRIVEAHAASRGSEVALHRRARASSPIAS